MTKLDEKSVIAAIQSSWSSVATDRVALHEPLMGGREREYVLECIDSNFVSSVGQFVGRFEQELAAFIGTKRAVAVVNGTAALHIALLLVGVQAGDEVLLPALTFVATANAVAYCGAIPHFVDVDERTLGMDPDKLDEYLGGICLLRENGCYNKLTGRRISAVVPMHTFGHPVDLDRLQEVCQRYGLEMVEDAAESLGSYYKGRHTGRDGKVATLSFNGNKIVTTGGGGAIVTDDEALADRAKHLTTTAKIAHPWAFEHDAIGYNYRLPNLNAALGCAQLEQLPLFLKQKRQLAERYRQAFAGVSGVRFFVEPSFATSNYWLNALILEDDDVALRDHLLEQTHAVGIMTRPVWRAMHTLEMFKNSPRSDLTTTLSLERRIVNIPSSAFLGGEPR